MREEESFNLSYLLLELKAHHQWGHEFESNIVSNPNILEYTY